MKHIIRCLAIVAVLVNCALPAFAAKHAEHVIIISIDGGKPAVIRQSQMPALNGIVSEGASTWTANTINPSITLPSHTSMLTGVTPEKHHILWNDWQPASGLVQVETVFSLAKQAGLTTAMFVGKEKFRHLLRPGTVDTFDYSSRSSTEIVKQMGDAKPVKEGTIPCATVAAHAAAYLKKTAPNVCFIHFADPDTEGHAHGWGSPEQIKAFGRVDAALAAVIEIVRKPEFAQSTVVIITADHGGHDHTHGSKSPEDMNIPWIVWGKGVKKDFKITEPVSICDTAATALWLLDVPRPENLDGKPVTSAFE